VTQRATIPAAQAPPRPPEAVLAAARAIGRAMALEALETERGAAQPRAMPNPRP
jgi:hypothetical protein